MDRENIQRGHSTTPPSGPPSTNTSTAFGQYTSLSRDKLYAGYGPRELRKLLHSATAQLEAEALRASEAERELQNLTVHLKRINDARLAAQQEALKAKEELKLYSTQLNAAQEEIYRAQDVLRVVDRQRYEAEKDAANSRSVVRKLSQEIVINAAREEGKRIGLREGLERGRSIGFREAQFMARFGSAMDEDEESDGDEDNFLDYVDRRRSHFTASLPNVPPPPPEPIPIPPPETTNRAPNIRPTSYRNASPSVRHSSVSIPPDGYIPALDADHFIRIPPPHELSRLLATPERKHSPPLPEDEERAQENGMLRSIPHPAYKGHHQSPPGSNSSTTLSQFDMVNEPGYGAGRRTPLSIIHEALSVHTSPNPESARAGHELKHQSSWGGSSHRSVRAADIPHTALNDFGRMMPAPETRQQGVYRRPRATSSSSSSPSALNPPREHHRRSNASIYTVPDINIQPPSRPESFRQESEAPADRRNHVDGHSKATSPDDALPIPPPFSTSREYYQRDSQTPGSDLDERPVIPDANLYRRDLEDDVSSAISSMDTLTTPPPNHARRSRIEIDVLPASPPEHTRNGDSFSNGQRDKLNRKYGPFSGSNQ